MLPRLTVASIQSTRCPVENDATAQISCWLMNLKRFELMEGSRGAYLDLGDPPSIAGAKSMNILQYH